MSYALNYGLKNLEVEICIVLFYPMHIHEFLHICKG